MNTDIAENAIDTKRDPFDQAANQVYEETSREKFRRSTHVDQEPWKQQGRAHFADAPPALLFSQLRFENPPSAGSNELSANAIPRVPQIFARLRGCYPSVATTPLPPPLLSHLV